MSEISSSAVFPSRADKALDLESFVVAAPLYDAPELRDAAQALWDEVRGRLAARGVEAPAALGPPGVTQADRLLLGQVSGFQFATELVDQVTLAATPSYRARGVDGPFIRSALVVPRESRASCLADLRGGRLAFVEADATGVCLLRAEIAPLAVRHPFFGALQPAPDYLAALEALSAQTADAALLDAATLAYASRLRPAAAAETRVLLWTTRSPAPPWVVSKALPAAVPAAIGEVLLEIGRDPGLRALRSELLIDDFHRLPKAQYRAVLHCDQIAESLGYPTLA